jgi:hypothetical protein
MVFMTWLAVVFVWFAVTVLRNKRNYFAWGALWSAVFILGATNLINPEKFIVETNLRLMQQGREFDAHYNASLSDDALPTLVNSFDRLNSDDAVTALRQLKYRACMKRQEGDWRTWNLSRQEANATLNATGVKPEGCVEHQVFD